MNPDTFEQQQAAIK